MTYHCALVPPLIIIIIIFYRRGMNTQIVHYKFVFFSDNLPASILSLGISIIQYHPTFYKHKNLPLVYFNWQKKKNYKLISSKLKVFLLRDFLITKCFFSEYFFWKIENLNTFCFTFLLQFFVSHFSNWNLFYYNSD